MSKKAAAEPKVVVIDEREDLNGKLKHVGGSRSDAWNNILAAQAIYANWLAHADEAEKDRRVAATIHALAGVGPKDELEGMLAAQLLASHNAAMECYRRGP